MQKEILTYEGLVELVDQLKKYTDEKGSLETYPTRYNFPVIGAVSYTHLPDSEFREMLFWIDAVPSRVKLYDDADNFTQTTPQYITIGSPDCDVWVYRMKSYRMNLTDDEILDNRIADAKNAEEMLSRYYRCV